MIYCYRYRSPQTREEHNIECTQEVYLDIAITIAISKRKAIKRFSKYYRDVKPRQVINVTITKWLFALLFKRGVIILTDY